MHSEAKRYSHFKHYLISWNDDRKQFPRGREKVRGGEIDRWIDIELIGSPTLYTFALKNICLISFSFLSRLSFSVFTSPINYSQAN